jgi:hypothetical protein
MFCKKCGKELDEDSAFCSYCGVPLTAKLSPLPQIQDAVGGYRLPEIVPPGDISNPRTGKNLMLYGLCIFVISSLVACSGSGETVAGIGITGAVIGLGTMIVGKMQHWYDWE